MVHKEGSIEEAPLKLGGNNNIQLAIRIDGRVIENDGSLADDRLRNHCSNEANNDGEYTNAKKTLSPPVILKSELYVED